MSLNKSFSFHIMTFGCKVNQYESQALREYWTSLGGREENQAGLADVILVSSCAVTAEAVSDARQTVRKLAREFPEARLIVTGCAATAAPDDFSLPQVRTVVPQAGKARLLAHHPLAEDLDGCAEPVEREEARLYPPFAIRSFRRSRPVLKVQDGCSHGCAYCIVPLTRGPARSRSPEAALSEARTLLEAGYREIMISGVNLRQYRHGEQDFWDLLLLLNRALAPEWKGRARFRLSSLEPAQLDERGVEVLSSCELLCPHLHLSLQSGSSTVLSRMGRKHYRPEDILASLEKLAKVWPVYALGADILMGFPGETEEELIQTLDMVEAMPLTYAHVFPWSSRPGTRAAALPGHLPREKRRENARRVREKVEEKHRRFLEEQLAAPSLLMAVDREGASEKQVGINEYYVPCLLEDAGEAQDHELVQVTPVGLENGKLKVVRRRLS